MSERKIHKASADHGNEHRTICGLYWPIDGTKSAPETTLRPSKITCDRCLRLITRSSRKIGVNRIGMEGANLMGATSEIAWCAHD